MKCLLVLVLFMLVIVVNSSHFRGGTISWKPIHGQTIKFTFKMGWTYGSGPGCTESKIGQFVNDTFIGDKFWKCVDGCAPDNSTSISVGTIYYYCTAADTIDEWEQGENSFQYNFTGSGPFTVSYTGAMWMPLDFGNPNGWILLTTIDLRVRDDINFINSSPISASKPLYTLQYGCYQELHLPMHDPDGDLVKCRWARDQECDSVCQALPDANLDEDTCTLKFNTSRGTLYRDDGWYAVALTFEDFPKKVIHFGNKMYNVTMALSTVPLQFLIHLVGKPTPCNWKPVFVEPTPLEGSKISIPENTQFDLKIYAANTANRNERVTKLSLTRPAGLTFQGPTDDPNRSGVVYWHLAWTPSVNDRGTHIVCGMAEDSSGHVSDTRCITLIAWDILIDPCSVKSCPSNQLCSRIGSTLEAECVCPVKTKLFGQMCIAETTITPITTLVVMSRPVPFTTTSVVPTSTIRTTTQFLLTTASSAKPIIEPNATNKFQVQSAIKLFTITNISTEKTTIKTSTQRATASTFRMLNNQTSTPGVSAIANITTSPRNANKTSNHGGVAPATTITSLTPTLSIRSSPVPFTTTSIQLTSAIRTTTSILLTTASTRKRTMKTNATDQSQVQPSQTTVVSTSTCRTLNHQSSASGVSAIPNVRTSPRNANKTTIFPSSQSRTTIANLGFNSRQSLHNETSYYSCMKSKEVVLFITFIFILLIALAIASVILTYTLIKTKKQIRVIMKTTHQFEIQ